MRSSAEFGPAFGRSQIAREEMPQRRPVTVPTRWAFSRPSSVDAVKKKRHKEGRSLSPPLLLYSCILSRSPLFFLLSSYRLLLCYKHERHRRQSLEELHLHSFGKETEPQRKYPFNVDEEKKRRYLVKYLKGCTKSNKNERGEHRRDNGESRKERQKKIARGLRCSKEEASPYICCFRGSGCRGRSCRVKTHAPLEERNEIKKVCSRSVVLLPRQRLDRQSRRRWTDTRPKRETCTSWNQKNSV